MPLVQVSMLAGRTTEQKRDLIAKVSAAVSDAVDAPVENVRVVIYEVSTDNWGVGGLPIAEARRNRNQSSGSQSSSEK